METNDYLKKTAEYFNKESKERFVSYGEILEELGFDVDRTDPQYMQGWYNGEFMSWDRYLLKRYKTEHPEDPNLEYFYCDPSNVSLDFGIDDI